MQEQLYYNQKSGYPFHIEDVYDFDHEKARRNGWEPIGDPATNAREARMLTIFTSIFMDLLCEDFFKKDPSKYPPAYQVKKSFNHFMSVKGVEV